MVEITNTEMTDLREIFRLFEQSINYQETKGYPVWKNYDKNAIIKDIGNKNQYKVVINSKIGIVFSIGYSDKVIWRELDKGDSIYLHRIVVNPEFKGQKLFRKILDWAIVHSKQKGLSSIRMDTWAANPTIIEYYKSFRFNSIENYTTPDSEELPLHNRNLSLTLLEYPTRNFVRPRQHNQISMKFSNALLSAKHWQIFLILISFIIADIWTSSANKLSGHLTAMLVPVTCLSWILGVGFLLNKKSPYQQRRFTPILAIGLSLMVFVIVSRFYDPAIRNINTTLNLAFQFYAGTSLIVIATFAAKSIKMLEIGPTADINDYFGDILLILFLPVGIWYIQPRINKITNDRKIVV